jgi:hypothetical protein
MFRVLFIFAELEKKANAADFAGRVLKSGVLLILNSPAAY